MEYAAMLGSPGLVSGMKELLDDEDTAVVKRTVRVFTNVYRHALQLAGTAQLDEATLTAAWPAVSNVAEHLLAMLPLAENEGITVHVVRFLEAAVVAHLVADCTTCPVLVKAAPHMVSRGVDALTNLVTTPYVGGSAYLVAVRALITVACYKPDMWAPVTSILQKQIQAPPPTLFDHNVRSLHKTLQRNLFRLLRRANTQKLRTQLIEMMVTVGVPRRMLSQWAAPQEPRKRPQQVTEDDITGRGTPPGGKRPRTDIDIVFNEVKKSPPHDPRDPRGPRDPRVDGRNPRTAGDSRDPRDPRDPRALRRSPTLDTLTETTKDTTSQPQKPGSPSSREQKKQKKQQDSNSSKHLEFLQRVINSKSAAASPDFLSLCSEKERLLYDQLDHPRVVSLVLTCLDPAPNSPPEHLLRQLGRGSDVTGVREQLTRLLAPHVKEAFITGLSPITCRPSPLPTPSPPPTPSHRLPSPPSPPSSSRSTPSDPASLSLSDVDLRQADIDLRQTDIDLRQFLDRGFHATGDIDMRTQGQNVDPRRSPLDSSMLLIDPRNSLAESKLAQLDARLSLLKGDSIVDHIEPRSELKDPRSERTDPRSERKDPRTDINDSMTSPINTSTRLDPRIAMSRPQNENPSEMRSNTLDPRITQAFADSRLPREQMMGGNESNQTFNQGLGNQNMDFNSQQNNRGAQQHFENGHGGSQNFNQVGNQNFNQGSNPSFNQGSNPGVNQNFNQGGPNRGFNQGAMQGFSQNFDQGPNNQNNFNQGQNFMGNHNFNQGPQNQNFSQQQQQQQQQQNFMGNSQQNLIQSVSNILANFDLPPPFANGGGGNSRQDPRMLSGVPICAGPPRQMGHGNPHDNGGFMASRQPMFGPRGMGGPPGPWQQNMQHNRMGMMMMNGGAMFPPPAPPMHL